MHSRGTSDTFSPVRVLVVGGSGHVGQLVLPQLAGRHTIRVLDLRPPAFPGDYRAGDATDPAALDSALHGIDVVVHAAMMDPDPADRPRAGQAFAVNVTSVYQTLAAAHHAGVRHAVHLSSLSVFRDLVGRRLDETMIPDASDLYGLTKRLGEEVCRAAAAEYGMSINVLRLAWPTPDAVWPAWAGEDPPVRFTAPDGTPMDATAATDLAGALAAALEHRDGFQLFNIAGRQSARWWSTAKAQARLGWTPTFGAEG